MALTKKCKLCSIDKSLTEYARSASDFFDDSYVDICFGCIEKRVNFKDLNKVDKLLQWADIPFLPDDWIETWEANGNETFRIYAIKHGLNKFNKNVNWSDTNEMWRTREESGNIQENLQVFNEEKMRALTTRWGPGYTFEDYQIMDSFFNELGKTQSFVTATQEDQAKMLCQISLIVHKKLIKGDDVSKELKSYNDTIKSAGFEPKNSRNYGDFESVGELMNYLVRKGYKPKFYDGVDRDEVDLTIKNQQTYLRRLVANEPTLPDMVSQRKEAYRLSQQLEEEGLDDASLDKYETSGFEGELEGEEDFNDTVAAI